MISLPHALPFVRFGSSSYALCDRQWLSDVMHNATRSTDLPLWIAEDLTRGVEIYLSDHYASSTIESSELFERIAATLKALGLNQVAEHIEEVPPPVRISLTELARQSGSAYELRFFCLLSENIRSAVVSGTPTIEFHGLMNAAKKLTLSNKWSPKCTALKEEIETAVKQELSDAPPQLKWAIIS